MNNQIDFSDPMTYAMMAGVSLPEQIVMYVHAGDLPLGMRLAVSAVMFATTFGFNGFVKKPPTWRDEMKWIVPTALFGGYITGSAMIAASLFAADSAMTLYLRGDE